MSHSYERTARLRRAARISHARRIDCDITIKELALRCKATPQRISDIENGLVDVNVAELRTIARALNTTAEELNRGACIHKRVELKEDATA